MYMWCSSWCPCLSKDPFTDHSLSCVQAEIKRLQEANKAARKERQLIMKQQQEIQRMRQTTLKLHERLKLAGGAELVSRVSITAFTGAQADIHSFPKL